MSHTARPHPFRILCALCVLALPAGLLARIGLPAPLAVPFALLVLTIPLWWVLRRPSDEGKLLPSTIRTSMVLLAALGIANGAGLDPTVAGWLICAAIAIAIVFGSGARRGPRASAWVIGGIVIVVAIILWRPLALTLSSDGPAHVAAILDAQTARTLQPPDAFPGAEGIDPRFGVLHGTLGMLATWTGASAADTLRWAALFFGPLWLIAHATLIRRLGPGERTALLIALLFTLHAGGGRAFGLGAAAFPGSVAQTLCAFALAGFVRGASSVAAIALLALTALVHPFGWWATTIVLFCATGLLFFHRSTRAEAPGWLGWSLASVGIGTLLLLPRILSRGAAADGLHTQLQEVVLIGGGLFVADPFWIFRWGGPGSVLALPALIVLVLLSPRWARRREHRIGIALALPVWLISLNPLVAPVAWSAVSYLVVRLGRIVLTTWVWASLAGEGFRHARRRGRTSAIGVLLALIGLWGLAHEASTASLHLREPQVIDEPRSAARLDELTAALESSDAEWLVAAPRIGYGIRARGGPHLTMVPVAHASPNDGRLLERIARWRELQDPQLSDSELRERLAGFGDAVLLVDARTEEFHDGLHPYAYVPDAARSAALDQRLRELEVEVVVAGEGWTIFDLPSGETKEESVAASHGDAFRVESVSSDMIEASPGDELGLHFEFVATGSVSTVPQRVFVRLEGDMPEAPAALGGVSKLWRKLFVERSGRSRHRFGRWIVPADLVVPPDRWPGGRLVQDVVLRVPEWAVPGTYTVQVTTHDWTWHERLELRDYLRDVDRFSAEPSAIVRIGD